MRFKTASVMVAVLLLGQAASMRADHLPGSFRALEALALCDAAARQSDDGTRAALLERGLALAETAVAADDGDAAGHFAVFCNLGRHLQLHPLGWGSLTAVRRVRHAIDRALELAPASAQVLTAKGIMLLELPRLFGGDTAEGERLLRRALELAPGFADAEEALAAQSGGARSVVTTRR
jgi:hypothetical protein